MKGFTFSQLAVILMVVLGLTIAVVVAVTQMQGASGNIGQLQENIGDEIDSGLNLGLDCISSAGKCEVGSVPADCDSTELIDADDANMDCGDTKVCCTIP